MQVIDYNGRVEFMLVRKPAELRGLLKGLEPVIERSGINRESCRLLRHGRNIWLNLRVPLFSPKQW